MHCPPMGVPVPVPGRLQRPGRRGALRNKIGDPDFKENIP